MFSKDSNIKNLAVLLILKKKIPKLYFLSVKLKFFTKLSYMELITGCIILDAAPRHESDNRFL